MKDQRRTRRVGRIMRRGDPAAGMESLTRDERDRIQQRILKELRASGPAGRARPFLWAAACALVLLAAVGIWRDASLEGPRGRPLVEPTIVAGGKIATDPGDEELREAREIHFVTDSGTRVIWRLDPDFDL